MILTQALTSELTPTKTVDVILSKLTGSVDEYTHSHRSVHTLHAHLCVKALHVASTHKSPTLLLHLLHVKNTDLYKYFYF